VPFDRGTGGVSLNLWRDSGSRHRLEPLRPGEDLTHGDLRDPENVDRLLQAVDVLIHMAGTSVERPLPEIIENNLIGLHAVYEGARRHRVKRVVFASSNHSIGMHEVTERLGLDCDFRPDGFYGLSKMWGEGLARLYWDKHGIESVCVRIGSAVERTYAYPDSGRAVAEALEAVRSLTRLRRDYLLGTRSAVRLARQHRPKQLSLRITVVHPPVSDSRCEKLHDGDLLGDVLQQPAFGRLPSMAVP
jgi:thioester reductase-like protein